MKQENKKNALICLERAIKAFSQEEILGMKLSEDGAVVVTYLNGTITKVDAQGSSVAEMIRDVAASML